MIMLEMIILEKAIYIIQVQGIEKEIVKVKKIHFKFHFQSCY